MRPEAARRYTSIPVAAVVGAILALGTIGTVLTWRHSQQVVADAERRAATIDGDALKSAFQRAIESLRGASAMAVDGEVSRAEFNAFSGEVLPGSMFRAVAYSVVVPEADRFEFEKRNNLTISDTNGKGGFTPSASRSQHLVVVYVNPVNDQTKGIIGFDIASETARRTAAERSNATGNPTLSSPISLVNNARPGIFVIQPIRGPTRTVIGYVSSGIAVDDLVAQATAQRSGEAVSLYLGAVLLSGPGAGGTKSTFPAGGEELTVMVDRGLHANRTAAILLAIGTIIIAFGAAFAFIKAHRLAARLAGSLSSTAALAAAARDMAVARSMDDVTTATDVHLRAALPATAVHIVAFDPDFVRRTAIDGGEHNVPHEVWSAAQTASATGNTVSTATTDKPGLVAVPLLVDRQVPQAAIVIAVPTQPTSQQMAAVDGVADLARQTMVRILLSEVNRQAAMRSQLIVGLSERMLEKAAVVTILDEVLNSASAIMDGAHMSVGIRRLDDDRRLTVRHDAALPPDLAKRFALQVLDGGLPLSACVLSGQAIALEGEIAIADRFPKVAEAASQNGIQSVLCIPLRLHSGECFAAMCFAWIGVPTITADQRLAATTIADLTARALERTISTELVRLAAAKLNEFAQGLAAARTSDEVATVVRTMASDVVGASVADLWLIGRGSPAGTDTGGFLDAISANVPADHQLAHLRAVTSDATVTIAAGSSGLADAPLIESITSHGLTALVCVPIRDRKRTAVAVLALGWKTQVAMSSTVESVIATMQQTLSETLTRASLHEQEHDLIVHLQSILLPSVAEFAGLDIAVRYEPAMSTLGMGGDWYDAVVAPDGQLVAVIGDVSGHGSEAVATMAQLKAVIGQLVRTNTPLSSVFEQADSILRSQGSYATAQVVAFDLPLKRVSYLSAGHPFPLVRRATGVVETLTAGRRPLLGTTTSGAAIGVADFEPGDTLLMYTDGLIERRGHTIVDDIDLLAQRFSSSATTGTSSQRLNTVVAESRATVNESAPNDDDVAAIMVRFV